MKLTIELDTEEEGRIIAEVVELSGILLYGQTEDVIFLLVDSQHLRRL